MLEKIIVVAGLAISLMANGAWAGEHGAESADGHGYDRAAACGSAKNYADTKAGFKGQVTGHSSCDCSNDKELEAHHVASWTCTVDAYWEKK